MTTAEIMAIYTKLSELMDEGAVISKGNMEMYEDITDWVLVRDGREIFRSNDFEETSEEFTQWIITDRESREFGEMMRLTQ